MLNPPWYVEGTAERLGMPLLVCVADYDVNASPHFAKYVASRAPRGRVQHYPVGHFDVYHQMNPAVFEQVMADQIAFLRKYLLPAAAAQGAQPRAPAAVARVGQDPR